MSIPRPFRNGLIACVLLSAALGSAALTLGRSRGVALVGRTLDVAIPLALDSPGQAADLCAEADVFHGDTRVDAARVTARIEPASGQNAVVRVRSSLPVDEPVVTVYLRLGCGQKITRRYVLLAEEPGEASLAATAAPVPPALPFPAPAQPPARAAVAAAAAPEAAQATSSPAMRERRPVRPRAEREATPALRSAPAARAETALASRPAGSQETRASRGGRPRLSLDMLELATERDPQLRSSAGLGSAPSGDEQVRAQAAALWRSINAQPEDVLRDLRRVQALETDVAGLRAMAAGNDRTLAELRGQLSQSRQERSLTLAAIALLMLLLAAMVVTWWLRRGERTGGREWWSRRGAAADGASAASELPHPGPPGALAVRAAERDLQVDESMFESLKKVPRVPAVPILVAAVATPTPAAVRAGMPAADSTSGTLSSFHSSFQSSQMSSMRMVKAEELVDIQQQADFFMSLGQTEQAIDVLESHIHNNTETSALVWLDLLAIYRALKRRPDYELLRADFQRVFNAEVPTYDSTPTVSGGLEDYPRALTRIAALWPSPKVMDVIEESIFRKPGMAGSEPFDLEAYRELVMLYNLGREVVQPEAAPVEAWSASQQGKPGYFETSMQPLSVARDTQPPEPDVKHPDSRIDSGLGSVLDSGPGEAGLGGMVDLDSLLDARADPRDEARTTGSEFRDPQVPRPSPRLGLDIDLTAMPDSDRRPAGDSNSIDFELSEPDAGDTGSGKPGRTG